VLGLNAKQPETGVVPGYSVSFLGLTATASKANALQTSSVRGATVLPSYRMNFGSAVW
jgi:hypothetical protein